MTGSRIDFIAIKNKLSRHNTMILCFLKKPFLHVYDDCQNFSSENILSSFKMMMMIMMMRLKFFRIKFLFYIWFQLTFAANTIRSENCLCEEYLYKILEFGYDDMYPRFILRFVWLRYHCWRYLVVSNIIYSLHTLPSKQETRKNTYRIRQM